MKKQALFIVFVTFLALNNSQLYSSSSNQATEGSTLQLNAADPSFSLDYSNISSKIKVFSIYNSYPDIALNYYTIDNTTISNSSTKMIPISSLIRENANIFAENYFISNNNRFIILSTTLNGKGFLIIYDIDTKKSFTIDSTPSPYFVPLVTRLSDSPDVFFCINDNNEFIIIKYSFSMESFSEVFQANLFSNPSYIRYIDVYKLDDKIYCLAVRKDTKSEIYTSFIYIVNSNGLIYSKVFSNLEVYSFSQTDKGLFLETSLNGYFYMYYYINDSISKTNLQLTICCQTNIVSNTFIRPFSNQSLFILNKEKIEIINVNNSVGGTTFDTIHDYHLPTNFTDVYDPTGYPLTPYALDLSSGNQYLLGSNRVNVPYVISINSVNDPPQGFDLPSITTATCTYHCSPYLPNLKGLGGEISFLGFLYSNLRIIILAIFFIIIFIIIILVRTKVNKMKKEFLMETKKNNQISVNGFSSHCINCGSQVEKGSIFCENCGKRI